MNKTIRNIILLSVVLVPGRALAETDLMSVPVTVSDGTVLVADIYLPDDGGGSYPTIVTVTPFGRVFEIKDYVGNGYAHVNVMERGTGISGGTWCALCARDQQDIGEIVEWAAAQPWSTGKVAMMGGSIEGTAGLLGAAQRPPHLRAVVARGSFSDFYRDVFWQNGILDQGFYGQIYFAQTSTADSVDPTHLEDTSIFGAFLANPNDDAFWKERAVYPRYGAINTSTLYVSGWYDFVASGALRNFNSTHGNNTLIIGPWDHRQSSGVTFPQLFGPPFPDTPEDATRPGPADPMLAYLDTNLKGINTPQARVTYFDIGTNQWNTAECWPPEGSQLRALFLNGAPSGIAASLHDGSLTQLPPWFVGAVPDTYVINGAVGATDTFGTWDGVILLPHERLDQRPDELLELTYSTAPVSSPIVIAGPMALDFWASTTAGDTDWIAKVTDVQPDGTSLVISEGFLRASHYPVDPTMSSPAQPWMTNAGGSNVSGIIQYRINLSQIAATIQPGHSLRVDLSSGDTPTHATLGTVGVNTIYHDAFHPSRLVYTVRTPWGGTCSDD